MSSYFKQAKGRVAVVTRETKEEFNYDLEGKDILMITDPTNELGKKLNLTYVAIDKIREIYKRIGIEGEPEGYYDTSELNVPATFILTKEEGRIIYKFGLRDYSQRVSGNEILDVLVKLRNDK